MDFWRDIINQLPSLPEDGSGPPEMENLPERDPKTPVKLQKIVTEIYVYTSEDLTNPWFGSVAFQDIIVTPQTTIGEVYKLLESRKNRKRRTK